VASLEIGSPTFSANLDKLAKDPRVVGIRGFLWSPKLTLDPKQLASVKELEKKGMTLDIISRGDLNPKDKVDALASAAPKLHIIIDHLGGAKGETPDPKWIVSIQKLAKHPNVYVKFSSFFDMFNPNASEDEPWPSPTSLASYKPHFDVLMKAFGMAGSFGEATGRCANRGRHRQPDRDRRGILVVVRTRGARQRDV